MSVDTQNYATVSKDDTRAARIAQAVRRSRDEYQPQHAYTERGHQFNTPDKHQLEYIVTSLYYSGRHQQALDLILAAADFAKPLAGLSRELVDTGTRAALAAGDIASGLKFALAGRPFWRVPFVGLAESAADALLAAGQDALEPLILAGPSTRLADVLSKREGAQTRAFHSMLLAGKGVVDVDALAEELGQPVGPLRTLIRSLGRVPDVERSVRDL